jgi:hypothetical protein
VNPCLVLGARALLTIEVGTVCLLDAGDELSLSCQIDSAYEVPHHAKRESTVKLA